MLYILLDILHTQYGSVYHELLPNEIKIPSTLLAETTAVLTITQCSTCLIGLISFS